MKKDKIYRDLDSIPEGKAGDRITSGCLVLEGGAFRALYTIGVLDAMMEEDINFSTVTGVSAGALSAVGYITGQIGWAAKIDLKYRHDKDYIGLGAYKRDHGITGFSHLFKDIFREMPIDMKRFKDPSRRLAVSATNMFTGEAEYFEKGSSPIFKAVQASATVPYISRPVMIDHIPYLDGGCAEKIPFSWARENAGDEKIVVVRTHEREFRREEKKAPGLAKILYKDYPRFLEKLDTSNARANAQTDELDRLYDEGKIFTIYPSEPVTVSRFEGNLDKLAELYWLGYSDMKDQKEDLLSFLNK